VKLTACLCWYDEPVEFLERCVHSLAGTPDALLAIDGRYEPFPAPRDLSPIDQTAAIERTASIVGLPATILGGGAPFAWPSQIAKRDHAMRHAAKLGDWILVIDADEWIHHADQGALRNALEHADHDVATITIRNITGHDHRNVDQPRRRIFRAGTTVADSHQGYTLNGRHLDGDTRNGLQLAPALDLTAALHIHHTPRSRGPKRNAAAKHYRHARANRGER
jgi:hypothetical protein